MTQPTATASPAVDALRTLVACEYGACYGISSAGGRLAALGTGAGPVTTVTAAYNTHRLRCDQLIGALVAAHAAVPVAEPAYTIPRLDTPRAALLFLGDLAASTIRTYRAALEALRDPVHRRLAVTAVVQDARLRTAVLTAAGEGPQRSSNAIPGN